MNKMKNLKFFSDCSKWCNEMRNCPELRSDAYLGIPKLTKIPTATLQLSSNFSKSQNKMHTQLFHVLDLQHSFPITLKFQWRINIQIIHMSKIINLLNKYDVLKSIQTFSFSLFCLLAIDIVNVIVSCVVVVVGLSAHNRKFILTRLWKLKY